MIANLFKIIKNSDKKITYLDYMKDKAIKRYIIIL